MPIHKDIRAYNASQSAGNKRICDALAKAIDQHLPRANRDSRPVIVGFERAIVVDAEHIRMRGELREDTVREFEHLAVNQIQFATAGELLEFRRQDGARLQRDNHASGRKRIATLGKLSEGAVQLIGLD